MNHDLEVLLLDLLAAGALVGLSVAVAGTAAWPLAEGAWLVVLAYLLLGVGAAKAPIDVTQLINNFTGFLRNPGSIAA